MQTMIVDSIVNCVDNYLQLLEQVDLNKYDFYNERVKLISNNIYDIAYIESRGVKCILSDGDYQVCAIKRVERNDRIELIPYNRKLKKALKVSSIKSYSVILSKAKLKFKLLELKSRILFNCDYKYYI